MARNNAHIEDLRLAENQLVRQPGEHADVRLLFPEMVLTVLEPRRYLRCQGKPCLDFKSRRWPYRRPHENRVRKAGVLPLPFAQLVIFRLIVQELDRVELDEVPEQRRQLGYDL